MKYNQEVYQELQQQSSDRLYNNTGERSQNNDLGLNRVDLQCRLVDTNKKQLQNYSLMAKLINFKYLNR